MSRIIEAARRQARDLRLAFRARLHGAHHTLKIVQEARTAGLPISLGFALIEQESGFRNVFGHDKGQPFAGAGHVTRRKYQAYKRARGPRGEGGMQGVGPAQLTYFSIQDQADRLGGCWRPRINIRVGFQDLAALIRRHGRHKGLAVYNGGAKRPNYSYAAQVELRQRRWHTNLTKET